MINNDSKIPDVFLVTWSVATTASWSENENDRSGHLSSGVVYDLHEMVYPNGNEKFNIINMTQLWQYELNTR